ncbi:hypothetical protein D3C71_2052000 [compost metagenome]
MLFQAHNAESQCRQAVFEFLCADGDKRWTIMVSGHQAYGSFGQRVSRALQDKLFISVVMIPQDRRFFTHVVTQFKTIIAQMVAFAD